MSNDSQKLIGSEDISIIRICVVYYRSVVCMKCFPQFCHQHAEALDLNCNRQPLPPSLPKLSFRTPPACFRPATVPAMYHSPLSHVAGELASWTRISSDVRRLKLSSCHEITYMAQRDSSGLPCHVREDLIENHEHQPNELCCIS